MGFNSHAGSAPFYAEEESPLLNLNLKDKTTFVLACSALIELCALISALLVLMINSR